MKYPLVVAALGIALVSALVSAAPARAQSAAPGPGRDMVQAKCFQCHTDTMFRDQRQDRRGWEAAIYRMVGRGGLWTPMRSRRWRIISAPNSGRTRRDRAAAKQ